mmetsp:Transcript_2449/g.3566  ORF Transcript_2449/g.3566 Transcript_2449/m.3566 type:complete len:518 (-) Transcript_2449:1817-3370(-)
MRSIIIATLLLICIYGIYASNLKVRNDQFFVDTEGRAKIFHGLNVVYKKKPYYPPILDKFDASNSLAPEDFKNLKRWGQNVIRLYVAWQGVEPEEGKYDQTYLDKIKEIVRMAAKYDIYVLLDMHQDLISNFFCGEGVPDWVIKKVEPEMEGLFPIPLTYKLRRDENGHPLHEDCLKNPFFKYYFTLSVGQAFQDLYENTKGIADSFAAFWKLVATQFKDEPNVAGYELINEPWAGNIYRHPMNLLHFGHADKTYLMPFYKRINEAIRSVDNETIVFYEPMVSDVTTVGFESGPGGPEYNDRQAFSYHVYCQDVDNEGDPKSKWLCHLLDDSFFRWREEASKRIGGGVFLTEFGALSNSTSGIEELDWVIEQAEKRFHSWAYWQFKYYEDFTTADMPGTTESLYTENGELKEDKVRSLSRPYAPSTCGAPKKQSYNYDHRHYQFQFTYQPCKSQNATTDLYLSPDFHYTSQENMKVNISPDHFTTTYDVSNGLLSLIPKAEAKAGEDVTVIVTDSRF